MKLRTCVLALLPLAFVAVGVSQPADEPIQPIRPAEVTRPAVVELGKKLFFDPRLSKSGFISCNSCHNLSMGGSDNLQTSIGDHWQRGPINSPTVLNSSMSLAQFWDGRAKDLKEQAGGPIANPGEMAFTHQLATRCHRLDSAVPRRVRARLRGRADRYRSRERGDRRLRRDPGHAQLPLRSLAQGERKRSPRRSSPATSSSRTSVASRCHNGPAAGGTSFQKMGVVQPYVTTNPAEGRVGVTHDEFDRFRFKVPTLRNVELTYPYFHDGEARRSPRRSTSMGQLQLGNTFTPEENATRSSPSSRR